MGLAVPSTVDSVVCGCFSAVAAAFLEPAAVTVYELTVMRAAGTTQSASVDRQPASIPVPPNVPAQTKSHSTGRSDQNAQELIRTSRYRRFCPPPVRSKAMHLPKLLHHLVLPAHCTSRPCH